MVDERLDRRGAARAGLADVTLCAGRLLIAYLFVSEGVGKIVYYSAVRDYMSQHGVAPALLPLVISLELGGGLLVAVGFLTQGAAAALAAFCLLTAVLFHGGGDAASDIEFRKNFALCGGLLALAARGPGALALDAILPRWPLLWPRRRPGGQA
ncbi:MAG TPA: DoxX family protein [Roseiarcus sp.]|nr:DoxX family protein [Roseiarcus sp.]